MHLHLGGVIKRFIPSSNLFGNKFHAQNTVHAHLIFALDIVRGALLHIMNNIVPDLFGIEYVVILKTYRNYDGRIGGGSDA